ncbi:MAG: hypothetical protein JXM70_24310 [Pirellulales bacterium]|nr:hypothetical protein [Pirellulales bacterium]
MDNDESQRRAYWAAQLDDAHDFMMKIMEYPVEDCGERLVSLPDAADAAGVEVFFSARPHANGSPRVFVLRKGQIDGFIHAAGRLNDRGWAMRVEDGYRNRMVQKSLGMVPAVFDAVLSKVVWELDGRAPQPDFLFKRLLTLVAQMPKIGTHMSGSAIDISVVDRDSREDVDRGGPYLELSELTPMDSHFVSPQAAGNRRAITDIMSEGGFVAYPYEFWHYSGGDAYEQCLRETGRPGRYGAVDFDPVSGEITPIENPCEHLNSLEEIQAEIQVSMQRLGRKG